MNAVFTIFLMSEYAISNKLDDIFLNSSYLPVLPISIPDCSMIEVCQVANVGLYVFDFGAPGTTGGERD